MVQENGVIFKAGKEKDSGGGRKARIIHGLNKGLRTPEEDAILIKYVQENGERFWNDIWRRYGLMSCGESCRHRWMNNLRSNLKKEDFTLEEKNKILRLHAQHGNRWSLLKILRLHAQHGNRWSLLAPHEVNKARDTVMSDSEDSTVTYTEVSSPFEDLSDIGSPGVVGPEYEGLPWMLDDPYVQVVLQAPPSPDYVPGPEEPEQAPPLPDFVPEPVYPEFMPPEDEVLPAEEQPLPAAASPTADSPGYVPESDPEEDPEEDDDEDPEEDPADYPADGGDLPAQYKSKTHKYNVFLFFEERHNIFISGKFIKVLTMNSRADLKEVSKYFQIEVEFLLFVHSEPVGIIILMDKVPELVHVNFRNICSDEKCGVARSESKSIQDNLKCRLSLFLSRIESSV
ncbi:putative reverse transcriptase domain-containing protein [Tanacetum coccineum]